MTPDPWGAVPDFLTRLTQSSTPSDVLESLIHGPLSGYTANSGALWHLRDDTLSLLAIAGYEDKDAVGFEAIPLDADLPVCAAVRDCTTVITGAEDAVAAYSDLQEADERWEDLRERVALGTLVAVPAVSRGVPVAVVGFACEVANQWTAADIALLEGLSSAVALWLQRVDGPTRNPGAHTDGSHLTDRQRAILALVASGRTNPAIAAQLGYSTSTVKQELRKAVRQLGATGREDAARRAVELGIVASDAP